MFRYLEGMANVQRTGETVKIKGQAFRIIEIRHAGANGSKFFGKFVFVVEDAEGRKFRGYGKRLAHNSNLVEVAE